MDRRITRRRTGLLTKKKIYIPLSFFAFCAFAAVLPFSAAAQEPRVVVQFEQGGLVTGSPWTLAFLVDHGVPAEVEVRPPPIPAALTQDRLLRELRLVKGDGADYECWTAVEYSFFLSQAGTITLGPFAIQTPAGAAVTSPVTITVTGAAGKEAFHPKLAWEKAPPRLTVGESAVFDLKMTGWPKDRPAPPPAFFLPAPPKGVILEAVPGIRDGAALRLHLIPLEAGLFTLPPRRLTYGEIVLEIPALNILIMRR
ncbi:MAG: hypothetical protein LBN21_02945 [Treponema sp.]|jgi:hypothetical protein|nr:hypothetical protein [Treponema sp.]